MNRIPAPTPTRNYTAERAVPATTPPTPPLDPPFSDFMRSGLEDVIDRFANSCQGIEVHLNNLLGISPSETSPSGVEPSPSAKFSHLENQLRTLRTQASWLEALAQRVYRI